MDKLIWLWLTGSSSKVLRSEGRRLNPSKELATWNWIFDRAHAPGRGLRCLLALRLRSLAYARSGVKPAQCHNLALADLAEAMPVSNPRVTRKQGPPARKGAGNA